VSTREIRVLGDPVLRAKAHKVTRFTDSLRTLAEEMAEVMHAANGVGLAAPQVGVSEQLIVVQTPDDEEELGSGQLYIVVNPEMVRATNEMVEGIEGCLSIPGYVGEVSRHESVTVKGQNLQGRQIRIKAQGYLARVFQHEIDHLEGVLFIDRLTAPDRIWQVEEGEEEAVETSGRADELVSTTLPKESSRA
jgi:peptide deformylase